LDKRECGIDGRPSILNNLQYKELISKIKKERTENKYITAANLRQWVYFIFIINFI
jgi:hypothetical protein